ncbi:hypothetical protein [Amycolatopsis sp. cmx-11-12]|uniref:hypothetical protein n=1 Tax=Amycolatopsis sp. cmx-11-12 TaxID=2785795 RepID=UPI003917E3F4
MDGTLHGSWVSAGGEEEQFGISVVEAVDDSRGLPAKAGGEPLHELVGQVRGREQFGGGPVLLRVQQQAGADSEAACVLGDNEHL